MAKQALEANFEKNSKKVKLLVTRDIQLREKISFLNSKIP